MFLFSWGKKYTQRLSCAKPSKKIFFQENVFYPRMRKRKIACKEPSELKIFQEIFSFFVNRTKKPHKWKKKPFSCQNSFIQSVSHMYLKTILLIFSPKYFSIRRNKENRNINVWNPMKKTYILACVKLSE